MSEKGAIMAKIQEDLELKKEPKSKSDSFLLVTPRKEISFRKEVRTSLGHSIKKLKRAFFSEPILRHKSRPGIAPMKLDLTEGANAAVESASRVIPSGGEGNIASFLLDDNARGTGSENNANMQNKGHNKNLPERVTLTDIAIVLSAVVFFVGVLSAFMCMALYVDLPVSPYIKQHAKSAYDASFNRLDIEGLKLACKSRISVIMGHLTRTLQTMRENIFELRLHM